MNISDYEEPIEPPVKIGFADFWEGFDPNNNFIISMLRMYFDVELDARPECLIYSVFGDQHKKYDCVRVLYSGENVRPDYQVCDYAFTCDHDDSSSHVRWPMFSLYERYLKMLEYPKNIEKLMAIKSKFCAMVVSNNSATERIQLFENLSRYRQVDSGGTALNNVGGPVIDKLAFLREYKFNICYENSCYPGYTTEKLVEALVSACIPIYWGNPRVDEDINSAAFVNRHDFDSEEEMIEKIISIDRDEELYKSYLERPLFGASQFDWRSYPDRVRKKFHEAFADAKAGVLRREATLNHLEEEGDNSHTL